MNTLESRAFPSVYEYKDRFEQALAKSTLYFGEKNKLRDACEYALTTGGKRLRPILTMMVADAIGKGNIVTPVALSSEYFHTASLIADDLPCMDNEEERRGRPSVHKMYGESTSVLASYALIAEAFKRIEENTQILRETGAENADEVGLCILKLFSDLLGIRGASGGQFLDLFPPNDELDTLRDTIYRKTITLYEGALLSGWLFGGGDMARYEEVKRLAYHFGMAFQIADDLGDMEQDKHNGSGANMALLLGEERARAEFESEMRAFEKGLVDLSINSPPFATIIKRVRDLAK